MASYQEDIASKLLHSSDARIAEAAKRVFSSTLPAAAASLAVMSVAPLSAFSSPSSAFATDAFEELSMQSSGVDQSDQNMASMGLPLYDGDEHTANFSTEAVESTVSNDEVAEDKDGGDKKPSSTERLKRSRERNRMHARKTRQRKKEHMQKLQNRADELKLEQIRLKQAINEKNTASILVGLFQNGEDGTENGGAIAIDPQVEVLLKRAPEDIPDASTIPELPALILPGQHNGKRKSSDGEDEPIERESMSNLLEDLQEDGIDYALLGKDRSSCSPSELDQIRRERNRMHAKRTRDRKRIFMEEMEVMIKQLEDDNSLLQEHANKLNANQPPTEDGASISFPPAITPELASVSAPSCLGATANLNKSCEGNDEPPQPKGDFLNQIESLLAAAGSFQKKSLQCEINAISCAESDVTASTSNHSDHNGFCEEEDDQSHELSVSQQSKRRRVALDLPTSVPKSITTTNYSL
eukprot:CAMPEP_0172301008 /NCGR_PEP_ID=MMETSP1058-20130122/2992_1 /TAXON_ID=83371 /ORGANISM="Detonula confervacea, Strain CCMP 353" /LENGTH=468 /DNA_ID=CAMNT_0013010993 /DNA_START=72 /DNA_END=1478 /DNA_ORIENTATION=+